MRKKTKADAKVKISGLWDQLEDRIDEYAVAAIGDSWKGGGDPADIPVVEAQLLLAKYKLDAHISKIRREYE